jgi:hypothetical protein
MNHVLGWSGVGGLSEYPSLPYVFESSNEIIGDRQLYEFPRDVFCVFI